jgi:hypothetical protein
MTAVLEVLRRARARLAVPGQWAKGGFAFDAKGKSVGAASAGATCWCVMGAVQCEAVLLGGSAATTYVHDARVALLSALPSDFYGLIGDDFNDKQATVEPVLDLFDRTIARLESEAAS